MEVTSKPSTSRDISRQRPAPAQSTDRAPPTKRHKPDIVAPSSPSKSKPHFQRPAGAIVDKEQEVRRQASLLSFAEARAKASSNYTATHNADADADFNYPPGSSGDSSARGLLEQIKNRMVQRAPKQSNFLHKAKQVQQSLLEKQQRNVQMQKAREEADKRESLRSAGFADQYAGASRELASQSSLKGKAAASAQGAFSRAKEHVTGSDDEESDDEPWTVAACDELVARNEAELDEDLVRVENLRPGPRSIPPDPNDPKWERMEPFSGHRLRERKIPHSQLKDLLRGRYHITSSLLYSVARPITMGIDGAPLNSIRNGDYEVPVDGDWIIIATIVEKSEIMVTKGFRADAPAARTALDGDDAVLFKDASDPNGKLRLDLEPGSADAFSEASRRSTKPQRVDEDERIRQQNNLTNRARKFVILKLVDLGVNGDSSRGHNQVELVAYESDQVDTSIAPRSTNIRSEVSATLAASSSKRYINGSRGAFELLAQQSEGTLVAIMNPKVLRPWAPKRGSLETKMFRITPRSAQDCLVIGQAADYRRCAAIKANGTRCGSFVDVKARKQTRTLTCDYHLSQRMDTLARGRPEFATHSTSRFGGASGTTNNVTSSYRTSNAFAKTSLAKKLNSSFGAVGDGMEDNGGQVYVSAPVGEVRASDPGSWKYDVGNRYGRGSTEKKSRLKKRIEEEELLRKIEQRFAPRERKAPERDTKGEEKQRLLPVLPNGTADLINAAYSTLDQRKQLAAQKNAAAHALKRKHTGVITPPPPATDSSSKLQFQSLSSSHPKLSANLLPINGPSTSTAGDSRSSLLSLASSSSSAAAEPSLKLRRSHRPKLRIPATEAGRKSNLKVVAGELIHLDDFDEPWEDDLSATGETAEAAHSDLSQRILHLHSQSHTDSDSDLEII